MTTRRALNRLEALGWALLASEHLVISPSAGRMLQLLARERPGSICTYEALHQLMRPTARRGADRDARGLVPTRLSRARVALKDIGFPEGVIENVISRGYRIQADHAAAICALIEQGLEPAA